MQNNEIHLDLVKKTKKLNRLQEKVTMLLRYSCFNHIYNCWKICICFHFRIVEFVGYICHSEKFHDFCEGIIMRNLKAIVKAPSANILRNNFKFHFDSMSHKKFLSPPGSKICAFFFSWV